VVAQVDEDHTAVIATAMHPACQHDLTAHAIDADLCAVKASAQRAHVVERDSSLSHFEDPPVRPGPALQDRHGDPRSWDDQSQAALPR
jgi:hypothetical protein